MVKGLKVGDKITMHWTVKKVLDDGGVALTHRLYPVPITINSNEIEEADVERGKGLPPKPTPKIRYEVGVLEKAPDGVTERVTIKTTENRDEAYGMKEFLGPGVWVHEREVKPPRKKR